METLEQLWLFVGVQTYPTGHLVLDLLESFLNVSRGFGSHGSVSSTADKLGRVKPKQAKRKKKKSLFNSLEQKARLLMKLKAEASELLEKVNDIHSP